MPLRPLLPLALALLAPLAGAAPAQRAVRSVGDGPTERLSRWVVELAEARGPLDPQRLADVEPLLVDLGLAWESGVADRKEIARAVLDLYGHLLARQHAGMGGGLASPVEERVRQLAGELLMGRAEDVRSWLARELVPMARLHPLERRAAAARALERDGSLEARLALFTATRDESAFLRDQAVLALVGREDEAVHARLLDLLEDAEAGRLQLRRKPIEEHFAGRELDPTGAAHARVVAHVRGAIAGEDWRRASRAVALSRCLALESAAPMLIEALTVWRTREAGGAPCRRIEGELVRELERRSGRRLGPHPDRWRTWWRAVQQGQVSLTGHGGAGEGFTQASFFGLRPMTDRVTFVLDRSGSMEAGFGQLSGSEGRAGRTRIREAAAQLGACLRQLGPRTHFDVVVFSDEARAWRGRLVPATEGNVASATGWVLGCGTGGGTHLRGGVEAALHLGPDGLPRLSELEADTVIVLCDGDTAEGPDWVRPTLRRANDEARVQFHAVRIGGSGDGTLEALCAETGGDFVRVDG